ncbi:MAG: hypothetical protein V2A53_09165 [bacterium]
MNTTTDDILTLYLRGYDAGDNLIGHVAGTWTILGGIGNCTPIYGTSTIFNPTTVGISIISATDSAHTDTTGAITVTAGNLSYLVISAPTTVTTNAGFSLAITGYDVDNNTATTFSGVGTLTNTTSSILLSTIIFASGFWTGQATITTALSGGIDTITVSYGTIKAIATITVFIDKQQGGTITGSGVLIEIGTISASCFARITTSAIEPTLPTGVKFAGTVYNIGSTGFLCGYISNFPQWNKIAIL